MATFKTTTTKKKKRKNKEKLTKIWTQFDNEVNNKKRRKDGILTGAV